MSDKVFIRGLLVFLVVTFVLWVITYNMYERRGDEIEHLKEQHKYMLQSFKEAADVYCKAVIATNLDEMECLSLPPTSSAGEDKWILTSEVLKHDPETGRIETRNTVYLPEVVSVQE